MSKRDAVYFDEPGDGESSIYDITADADGFSIRYSELDPNWTSKVKGKIAATVIDHGNGITLRLVNCDTGHATDHEIDYSTWFVLKLAMTEYEIRYPDAGHARLLRATDIKEV